MFAQNCGWSLWGNSVDGTARRAFGCLAWVLRASGRLGRRAPFANEGSGTRKGCFNEKKGTAWLGPCLFFAKDEARVLLSGGSGGADFGADDFAGDDDFYAAILLAAVCGVVAGYRV
jgi:hypothetical protein